MGTGSPVSGADGHVAAPRALVGMEPEPAEKNIYRLAWTCVAGRFAIGVALFVVMLCN